MRGCEPIPPGSSTTTPAPSGRLLLRPDPTEPNTLEGALLYHATQTDGQLGETITRHHFLLFPVGQTKKPPWGEPLVWKRPQRQCCEQNKLRGAVLVLCGAANA